jgi:DMSO/TMAO reductase YedYZ molybdopterin-dependent catalytic subunit
VGAVSEARWSGTPLAAVLARAGVLPGARAVVLEGAERGPFAGLGGTHAFARALPLAKALRLDTLLAWAVASRPVPLERGGPVRAIVPGWYATDSVKWLTRVTVLGRRQPESPTPNPGGYANNAIPAVDLNIP